MEFCVLRCCAAPRSVAVASRAFFAFFPPYIYMYYYTPLDALALSCAGVLSVFVFGLRVRFVVRCALLVFLLVSFVIIVYAYVEERFF